MIFIEHLLCARLCLESSQALTHFVLTTHWFHPHFMSEETGLVVPWASPVPSKGKYSFPLLKPSLACSVLLLWNIYSPTSMEKFRHHPTRSAPLKMGLPYPSGTYSPGRSNNCLSESPEKFLKQNTAGAWASLPRESGLGALEPLSSESCPGATDTHQVWGPLSYSTAHGLALRG